MPPLRRICICFVFVPSKFVLIVAAAFLNMYLHSHPPPRNLSRLSLACDCAKSNELTWLHWTFLMSLSMYRRLFLALAHFFPHPHLDTVLYRCIPTIFRSTMPLAAFILSCIRCKLGKIPCFTKTGCFI
jgi:hypothetical protein